MNSKVKNLLVNSLEAARNKVVFVIQDPDCPTPTPGQKKFLEEATRGRVQSSNYLTDMQNMANAVLAATPTNDTPARQVKQVKCEHTSSVVPVGGNQTFSALEWEQLGKPFEFTVPDHYQHHLVFTHVRAEEAKRKNDRGWFWWLRKKSLETPQPRISVIDPGYTDATFRRNKFELIPGQKYRARFLGLTGSSSLAEGISEYRSHNALPIGAQGLALVWTLHWRKFPRGRKVYPFSRRSGLLIDVQGGEMRRTFRFLIPFIERNHDQSVFGFRPLDNKLIPEPALLEVIEISDR
jgi:hypothetical protein